MYLTLLEELHIDCEKCSGLCCIALYCSKIDGFPEDKEAEVPCKHLQKDFRCDIHHQLSKNNLKGCMNYECFGAGQKVTEVYKALEVESHEPKKQQEMYRMFVEMTKLHQIRWYLVQALQVNVSQGMNEKLLLLIEENKKIGEQEVVGKLEEKRLCHRERANTLLRQVTEQLDQFPAERNKSFFGKHFKGKNLDGHNFSMSLMIAANLEDCSLKRANFLGADMRDTNIKNTDLSESLFLTQMQINSAKGNAATKLPAYLRMPTSWQAT